MVRIANETRANALDEPLLEGLVSLLNGPRPAEVRAVLLAGAGDRHLLGGARPGRPPPQELSAYLEDGARRMQAAARAIAEDAQCRAIPPCLPRFIVMLVRRQ